MELPKPERHEKKRKKKSEDNSEDELYLSLIDVREMRNQLRDITLKYEKLQKDNALYVQKLNEYEYNKITNKNNDEKDENKINDFAMEADAEGSISREDENDGQWHTVTGRKNK